MTKYLIEATYRRISFGSRLKEIQLIYRKGMVRQEVGMARRGRMVGRQGMEQGREAGGMVQWELSAQIINDTKQAIQSSGWGQAELFKSEAMALQPMSAS